VLLFLGAKNSRFVIQNKYPHCFLFYIVLYAQWPIKINVIQKVYKIIETNNNNNYYINKNNHVNKKMADQMSAWLSNCSAKMAVQRSANMTEPRRPKWLHFGTKISLLCGYFIPEISIS